MPAHEVHVIAVKANGNILVHHTGGAFVDVPRDVIEGDIRRGDVASLETDAEDAVVLRLTRTTMVAEAGGYVQNVSLIDIEVPGLATTSFAIVWPLPWVDTSYEAFATPESKNADVEELKDIRYLGIISKTTTGATFALINQGTPAQTLNLRVVGVKT